MQSQLIYSTASPWKQKNYPKIHMEPFRRAQTILSKKNIAGEKPFQIYYDVLQRYIP